jgi:hypothetical protein
MNNRNQQTNRAPRPFNNPSPASAPAATHLNVFTVEEYESNGKAGKRWTKIGAAFPHKEGPGFSIELSAIPLDSRIVVLPPCAAALDIANRYIKLSRRRVAHSSSSTASLRSQSKAVS